MKIKTREKTNEYIVDVIGKLDSTSASELEFSLKSLLVNKKNIVLDFSKVQYVSSGGLRALLNVQKILFKDNKKISVIHANDLVKEIFQVTGFGLIIDID